MQTAKVFLHGTDQFVHIPKEFQFDVKEQVC